MGCASSASVAVHARETGSQRLTFKECYDVRDKLGEGSFAQVRSCLHKKTKNQTAVKIVKTGSEKERSKASRELEVWTQVGDHANVVVLLEHYVEPSSTFFVMQQCKCSVSEMVNTNTNFGNGDLLDIFHQVFLGLQHCHSMKVVHRDIKAANLLVDFDGVVKIADFGLSLTMPTDGISGIAGSTPYMSPEMVKGKKYGFGTDVWSCAAVMYFLVYGVYPYDAGRNVSVDERKMGMMKAIATNTPKPKYEPANGAPHPSFYVQELIQTLLQRDVAKRPDADLSAKLLLTAKARLECTKCESLKSHKKVDYSTESTRDTNTVVSETSSSPVSEYSSRVARARQI